MCYIRVRPISEMVIDLRTLMHSSPLTELVDAGVFYGKTTTRVPAAALSLKLLRCTT